MLTKLRYNSDLALFAHHCFANHKTGDIPFRCRTEIVQLSYQLGIVYRCKTRSPMENGELYRSYFPQKDGLVLLDDDPGHGFGAERTSRNSLFMEDDFICAAKRDWLKRHLVIDGQPSLDRIAQAQARQRQRLGDAYYPHPKPCDL